MPGDVRIRPLEPPDIAGADAVCMEVLLPAVAPEEEPVVARARAARIAHLHATDPGGAWVAEVEGRVVGVALALVREGIWGLSLLAVAAARQSRGVGRRLLERAWAYGEGARGHIILSSTSPAAMRRYAHLGLALRPCVAAAGVLDGRGVEAVDGVVEAGVAGVGVADAIGRAVRGAGHGRDLPRALADGGRLLLFEDRAFAVVRSGNVWLLAARDEAAAAAVLRGAFAALGPGASVEVGFLSAGQDWAVRACLDAGLALSPDGPIFAGGELGPMAPYVPSGAYL